MAGMIAMGASLGLLINTGLPAIGQRILEITNECCRRLNDLGAKIVSKREKPDHSSGIVTFEFAWLRPASRAKAWIHTESRFSRIAPASCGSARTLM